MSARGSRPGVHRPPSTPIDQALKGRPKRIARHQRCIQHGTMSRARGTTFVFLSSLCHELLGSCAPKGQNHASPAQRAGSLYTPTPKPCKGDPSLKMTVK
jgi:hypothetical protein